MATKLPRKRLDAAARRETILAAATEVLQDRGYVRALIDLIANGQRSGSLRGDVSADALAWLIMSLLHSQPLRQSTMDTPAVDRELAALTLATLRGDHKGDHSGDQDA